MKRRHVGCDLRSLVGPGWEKHNAERGRRYASFTMWPCDAMWNDRSCHGKARGLFPFMACQSSPTSGLSVWNRLRDDILELPKGRQRSWVFLTCWRCLCGWVRWTFEQNAEINAPKICFLARSFYNVGLKIQRRPVNHCRFSPNGINTKGNTN